MKPFREVYAACDSHDEPSKSPLHVIPVLVCNYGAPYCSSILCPKRKEAPH
jgi:hypothetical protein